MLVTFQYGDFNFEVINSVSCKVGTSNEQYSNGLIKGTTFSDSAIIPSIAIDKSTNRKYKVTETTKYCFRGCTLLKNCFLPSTLKFIGWDSFFDTQITSLIIPRSVEVINYSGFSGMRSLETILFEEGSMIKHLGNFSFAHTQKLTKVVLPPTLKSIESSIFVNAKSSLVIDFIYCGSNVITNNEVFSSTATINVYVTNRYPSETTFCGKQPNILDNDSCSRFFNHVNLKCTNRRKRNIINHVFMIIGIISL